MVRLKGGDRAYLWSRRRELKLCHAGIPFSVCGDYRGGLLPPTPVFPLTHRDYAQSVRLVTGHLKTGGELDWKHGGRKTQTLVFYVRAESGSDYREKLIAFGMRISPICRLRW